MSEFERLLDDALDLHHSAVEGCCDGEDSDAAIQALIDYHTTAIAERDKRIAELEALPREPIWIVNDSGELGVKIGNRLFFLYKGGSIEYDGVHDDGEAMLWRPVGKREFGEVCRPVQFYRRGAVLPERYTQALEFIPGLSDGAPGDADWRPFGTKEREP